MSSLGSSKVSQVKKSQHFEGKDGLWAWQARGSSWEANWGNIEEQLHVWALGSILALNSGSVSGSFFFVSLGKLLNCSEPQFLLHVIATYKSESCSVTSDSLRPYGLYSPWNSLGQNIGVDSLSLLRGIFPTQGSNPGLPYCKRSFLPAESQGKSKNTGVVAYPFSSGSSQPRNQTRVSCTAGRCFTNWAIREAL